MAINNFNTKGLTAEEVLNARIKYGRNKLSRKKRSGLSKAAIGLLKEPMVVLLLIASVIYFISGNKGDGIFLSTAIILVSVISLYQDSRSRNALAQLNEFTQPKVQVIRDGNVLEIKNEDLVVGDSLIVEEGTSIPADGIILHANDFSVNESILTGESFATFKDQSTEDHLIFSGTTVASGRAIVAVTAVGNATTLGKIGKALHDIKEEKTPLELQINNFVKKMVIAGALVFIIVWAINYSNYHNVLDSLLKALTLAMSILPEEIPVAFTTFMALGALRLMKIGVIVKQMKTVETLGSATVICTDKTGTITENKMSLAKIYTPLSHKISVVNDAINDEERALIRLAMWASEPIPFDPMEIALHNAYASLTEKDERPAYKMFHEYPLEGKPPMMTHIFEDSTGNRIIAAKGAPEALINVSDLTPSEQTAAEAACSVLASEGYRVLAVGEASYQGNNFPITQQELSFRFKGVVAFYDPPKGNISTVLQDFYGAGINVKIVTGDNAITTKAIAKQIGLKGYEKSMSGDELMSLPNYELQKKASDTQVFTRMFPDAKLRIINALKAENEIVAMTGDGVNDGPALKSAHIGIAMGKKGTEIAKQAASLILLEDDLSKMVNAVAMGRRIYTNLKKAIRYIISIHIPIILTVFIPLALNWVYPNIFSPVHIIFLELIMGPTCSIIYENEPMEMNAMIEGPRPFSTTFFSWQELTISVIQGIAITVGTLTIYQYAVHNGYSETLTRTMVFSTLIASNIILTFVNRSFIYSIITTLKYKNNLVLLITGVTVVICGLLLYMPPARIFFGFEFMNLRQLLISIGVGIISVLWYELAKSAWRVHRRSMER